MLVDLDDDADCAAALCADRLPDPAPHLCFRVAVREMETWLLADREAAARFLSVPGSRIPQDPETVANPDVAGAVVPRIDCPLFGAGRRPAASRSAPTARQA